MRKEKAKFSLKVFLFLALLIAIILVISLAYNKFILTQKTFYKKELKYKEFISEMSLKEFDYVFFGDSHAFHDVNPEFIKNSYNYGTGAENYIKTYYKLRKMIYLENVTIKTVVLEADLHTFSTRLTDKTNLFNELELYSDFVSIKEIRKVRDEPMIKLWIEAYFPFISNGKEFGILLKPIELAEVNDFGWLKNKANFSLMDKNKVAFENYKDTFEGQERFSNISLEYFEKTLKLAEKNGINVVILKYPYAREYIEALEQNNITKNEYYNSIFERINSTINEYKVLDYSEDYLDQDHLFGDPAHLNYVGAELFSKKLNHDLTDLKLINRVNYKYNPDIFEEGNYIYLGIILILLELGLIYFILKKN